MAQFPKCSADKMRAETGFHPDYAGQELLKLSHQRKAFDLSPQYDPAVWIEANDVKNLLANIDTD